jgi:hypothetical protein
MVIEVVEEESEVDAAVQQNEEMFHSILGLLQKDHVLTSHLRNLPMDMLHSHPSEIFIIS